VAHLANINATGTHLGMVCLPGWQYVSALHTGEVKNKAYFKSFKLF
jgi:hypothetical protein